MSEKLNLQYAKIEQPFDAPRPIVHCPICGIATAEKSEDGYEVNSCKHLTFIFAGETVAGETNEFIYMSEDFKNKSEGNNNTGAINNLNEFLAKAGYGNELLALDITYSGMACGPVSFNDVYGFDFNSTKEDD